MPDCDQESTVGVEGDGYFGAEGFPADQAQEDPWKPELNIDL